MARHFEGHILPRERPFDTSLLVVSAALPCIDLSDEGITVRETPVKALAVKHANLNFRHVQPTCVLWRVVKDHSSQEFIHCFDSEHLLEALAEMGIQIVEHEMNAPRRRVDLFQHLLDEGHEVRLGAMIGNLHGPLSALGLYCHEQVVGTTPHVLVIQSRGCSGLDRQGRARILQQLLCFSRQHKRKALSTVRDGRTDPADRASAAGTPPSMCDAPLHPAVNGVICLRTAFSSNQ